MAIVVLLGAAALLAVLSEILVSTIEPFIETFGLSAFFVGVIIIPTIGNLAEHFVAVQLAWRNRMEFALAVQFGSRLQVRAVRRAGAGADRRRDRPANGPVVRAAGGGRGRGGGRDLGVDRAGAARSNWLEGSLLTIVYLILAVSFFKF